MKKSTPDGERESLLGDEIRGRRNGRLYSHRRCGVVPHYDQYTAREGRNLGEA